MKLSTRGAALGAVFVLASTNAAPAECGPHKTPTYGDVTDVRYLRSNCFGKCPTYEVLFSGTGLYYVGIANVEKHGTYEAPTGDALVRVRAVLEASHFFSLNDDASTLILDVPHFIIAVDRCRVTTKLDWPAEDGRRPDITALFDNLDAIVKRVPWHKASDSLASPQDLVAPIP